jgi:hypothetical protein
MLPERFFDTEVPVMSISIQAKTDLSYLFSSLGSSTSNVYGSNFLIDYASIKNGSYAKLMKAYYSSDASDEVKSVAKSSTASTSSLSKTESKAYAEVQTTTDALKDSADALLEKSLFEQKDITTTDENGVESTVKGYDTDAIYKAVNSFVTNYNSVIEATDDVDDSTTVRRVDNMTNITASNTKSLAAVGITVNEDNTLSIDKDALAKADVSKVKSVFNETGSYGYQVSAQASLINYAADNVINYGSYTSSGTYSNVFSSGNLFSTYF